MYVEESGVLLSSEMCCWAVMSVVEQLGVLLSSEICCWADGCVVEK